MFKILPLLVFILVPRAHAEYDVEWKTLDTKYFVCGNEATDQATFAVTLRYDLVTTHSAPKRAKRKEIRISIFDFSNGFSVADQWAAQILNLAPNQIMSGAKGPRGDDKIQTIFGEKLDASTDFTPKAGTSYNFGILYPSSSTVVTYKLQDQSQNFLFIDTEGTVNFKFQTENEAQLSVNFTNIKAYEGQDRSSAQPTRVEETKLKTIFKNLPCEQK